MAAGGGFIFAGDREGSVWRWRLASEEPPDLWRHVASAPLFDMTIYVVSGRPVLAVRGRSRLRLLDLQTGEQVGELAWLHEGPPRVAPIPSVGPVRQLLMAGDDWVLRRFDPLSGAEQVLTRWDTSDGSPVDDEFAHSLDAVCSLEVDGRDLAFVNTSEGIWRIDPVTGDPA
jgi:hypothetical protein